MDKHLDAPHLRALWRLGGDRESVPISTGGTYIAATGAGGASTAMAAGTRQHRAIRLRRRACDGGSCDDDMNVWDHGAERVHQTLVGLALC